MIVIIVYRQFEIFHYIDTNLIVCLIGDEIIRQIEEEVEREEKQSQFSSFRVSRCQGGMFYLKENNLRY